MFKNGKISQFKDEIIKLYQEGKNYSDIARVYNTKPKTIGAIIIRNGAQIEKHIDLLSHKKYIVSLYKQGNTAKKIAKLLNVGQHRILLKLREWGISTHHHYIKLGKSSPNWRGYKEVPQTLLTKFKQGAKSRDLEFNITLKDIWDLYEKQNGLCALTGEKLFFDDGYKLGNLSIDRINSSKGYYKRNCQLVSKGINISKQTLSNKDFKELCIKVANYAKSSN